MENKDSIIITHVILYYMCYYTGKTFFPSSQFDFTMQNRIGRIGKPIYPYTVCVYMYAIIEKLKKNVKKKSRNGGG